MVHEQTFDDLVFREPDLQVARRKRARRLLIAAGVICFGTALIWTMIFAARENWYGVAFEVLACVFAVWVTSLSLKGSVERAAHLLFWAAFSIILALVLLFDGPSTEARRAAHFFFLVLAVGIHFLFVESRQNAVRTGYAALALATFVVIEVDLVHIPTLVSFDANIRAIANVATITGCMAFMLVLTRIFVADIAEAESRLNRLNVRLEDLLENMLPPSVVDRLRSEGKTFAEGFSECSILFADLVGFTELAASETPARVVEKLNRVFSKFDDLVERHGLEKIKTIGDAYMVASGIPAARRDHAEALAQLAVEMLDAIKDFPGLSVRIGINSGPVVAGIIGRKRFLYDLWGDAVNVASRMESQGVAGRIHVTEETRKLLQHRFVLEPRGEMQIKGKGSMRTYLLVGPKAELQA